MLVYGRNVAKDILKKGEKVEKIFLQENFNDKEIISLIENSKIVVFYKKKREIDNLCSGVHQGILLFIPDYQYSNINTFLNKNEEKVVILDHIEDPHNLGAIIRTCEAAGIKSVIIPKDRQVQVNATVMKTSVGTLDNVNIVQVTNLSNTIDKLKENGYWIVGTALKDSVDYRDIDYTGKIALIVGNEGTGISNLVMKKCDFIAKIPMYGETNSLNASVAAGIMYKPIVKNISKEFYDRYSDYGYDYDDFIQEGYVGFQNALNKYDSSKGALFYTFVELCIRRRLLSFTKNISLPKRNISNKYFISLDDLDVRDNSVSLNDELDYEDTMNIIKDVLYSLDLKYTAPFELKMNNFSLKEISILLEVSINSVSYRVNLVRDEIRTRILCE